MNNQTTRRSNMDRVNASLKKRYAAEKRFRRYGLTAIFLSLSFLVLLFGNIISNGYSAFQQTYIQLPITFDPEEIDPEGVFSREALNTADYQALVKASLREMFPDVSGRKAKRQLYKLASGGVGYQLREMVIADPSIIGTKQTLWVIADDEVDMYAKGHIKRETPEENRMLTNQEIEWIETLRDSGALEKRFSTTFVTAGDSREPEQAGIRGALMGSFYTLLITLSLSFPIGIAAAIYLEEFAPKNRWTDLIEVNINNLAAVPSVVFGLLGLAVFINFFGLPRSVPLVGGLVLTLMTLPTIIIAARASLKSVPPSIREAAMGLGASRLQVVTHHVLPLAMPGMLTGTIIGMAQALGETAPLLMIGMVAFIVDIPGGVMDPSAPLPVQIFLWADSPERAFVEKTSGAIMVLLAFLACMNALAIYLRKRFERRW